MLRLRHAFLALTLVLCGWALLPPKGGASDPTSPEAPRSDAKYVIRIAPGIYMPGRRPMDVGEKLHGMSDVAREFERLYPDTHIEFTDNPGEREWLVTQLSAGTAPDILNVNVEDVWQDVQKGWYVALDPWLDKPNPFVKPGEPGSRQWWDMFKYQAISRGKAAPDGKMYCLTLDMIETGIFYNKTLFAKLGIKPPTDWPDFVRIQERIRKAGVVPMLIETGALADWGVDLMFDQFYRSIRPALDLRKDPKRDAYMKGYLDWDEICFLHQKGFFTKQDPRWREVFRTIKDWRRFMPKDIVSADDMRMFVTQQGAMYWSSSMLVNKLARDPELGFDWGVFYLPPIPHSYDRWAGGYPQCVIGGAATQFSVTNSAYNDTGDPNTSVKLQRAVEFLEFCCLPRNNDRIVNEVVALLPNIVGVEPHKELRAFAEILERDYTTTKWMFTFDLRFSEILNRMLALYLQGGIDEDEFMDWMAKNVDSATDTVIRRKRLDLSQFEAKWRSTASMRMRMEGLPVGARP